MTPLPSERIRGWATARSIARELPAPVADHGGWRVETNAPGEVRRYVFADATPAITALAASIRAPHVCIKLCDEPAVLADMLPRDWRFEDRTWVMAGAAAPMSALPAGYRIEREDARGRIAVRIVAPGGDVAASGYGANALGVFVYDRIVTHAAHRRRGLGRVMMAALGEAAWSDAAHVLVASDMGRALYESIGWRVCSAYATAFSPG